MVVTKVQYPRCVGHMKLIFMVHRNRVTKLTVSPLGNKQTNKQTIDYHKTQLLGTLKFENYWVNPKTDFVDPHQTKNGQNALSWSALFESLHLYKDDIGIKKDFNLSDSELPAKLCSQFRLNVLYWPCFLACNSETGMCSFFYSQFVSVWLKTFGKFQSQLSCNS